MDGPRGRDPRAEPSDPPGPDDPSSQRFPRTELRRKISLKFKEFQGFVNEYSENVSAGGMFVRTPSPQPVGTVFDFEFTLGDDYTLIHGLGEVVWVRERDEGFDRPPGMGVRFLSLDPGSRKLIDRMVAERLARSGDPGSELDPSLMPPPARPGFPEESRPPAGEPREELWWDDEGSAPAPAAGIGSGTSATRAELEEPPAPAESPADSRSSFDDPARARHEGPSPYIYSRTYQQGSGYSGRGSRSGPRPLLIVLLVVFTLVALAAAAVLIAPEAAQRWLLGGGSADGTAVARGPDGGGDRAPAGSADRGAPVEPVSPEEAQRLPPPVDDTGGTERENDAAGEADEEQPGFFPPAPVPESPPLPEPAPDPEPAPAPEPAPTSEASFSRVLNVVWEERGEETLVTVHLDGAIQEWSYSNVRLGSPARELVRIEGVERPFPRPAIPVGTDLVERVRLGFHPEGRTPQMHVVIDLADPQARLDRSEAVGAELRLWIAPGNG